MAGVDQRFPLHRAERIAISELAGNDTGSGLRSADPFDVAAAEAVDAPDFSPNARAAIVNRTHRVVRERAQQMKARRSSARDLVVPLLICSALLLMVVYAVWTVLAGGGAMGELQEEAGRLLGVHAMDTDGSLSVLFFWFVPVSAVVLGTVLFRRSRGHGDDGVTR